MILSQITGILTPEKNLPLPDNAVLRLVRQAGGGECAVLDTLGTQTGDRVLLGGASAAAALFGKNCPYDAVVLAVLPKP